MKAKLYRLWVNSDPYWSKKQGKIVTRLCLQSTPKEKQQVTFMKQDPVTKGTDLWRFHQCHYHRGSQYSS